MSAELTPAGLREVADRFRERYRPGAVRALLVAGTGLNLDVPGWQAGDEIALAEVLPFRLHELTGHRQTMTLWRRGEETILVMNGRLHLYQGYSPAEVVAPVRLAGLLGAELMLATNASGALDPAIPPGSLVVVSDHINLQGSNPLVGEWGEAFGVRFPDMSETYDPELRRLAVEAAGAAGFTVREGVYIAVLGPSFETPAEVRMLGRLGGAVVGMSTVPEVIVAVHCGLRVVGFSVVTDLCFPDSLQPARLEEIIAHANAAEPKLRTLVLGILAREATRPG